MKVVFALLLVIYYVECKKTIVPIDKHANLDFINMEGGGAKPTPRPAVPPPLGLATPSPKRPAPTAKSPVNPPTPTTAKPAPVTAKPAQPAVTPPQPKAPTQIKPIPVNPAPVANPASTPGPGKVKDLVNFYDSQGKGSPIRPYSYSQAVKQG